MRGLLVVVGDALLDRDVVGQVDRLAPDAPVPVVDERAVHDRPGGAALAAWLGAQDGRPVTLITALGDDDAGRDLRALLERGGVRVVDLHSAGGTPEKVRLCAGKRPLLRLDRGGAGGAEIGHLEDDARAALDEAAAVLVSDYGRGLTSEPTVRDALARVVDVVPVVWDPHPRGADPLPGTRLVTPNRKEAERVVGAVTESLADAASAARRLTTLWSVGGVVITLGRQGAMLVDGGGRPLLVPAGGSEGDPCGAGDRFASRVAGALADGTPVVTAVREGVASASAFVAAGGAMAMRVSESALSLVGHGLLDDRGPATEEPDAEAVAARVRSAGGTVVATGGCFDLLHAGHVAMLRAARSLGDCLVVCLNSDASVRRLKGDSRPLNSAADRKAVLLGLECVDAVHVFEEDTPCRALERLRPHVWTKAADYALADLPEATVLLEWGGQAVVLPYLENHSTTRLVQEVLRRASH